MNTPDAIAVSPPLTVLATEQSRQRLVTAALKLTESTTLAPGPYERELLARFVAGELTIDEVLARLEAATPADRP